MQTPIQKASSTCDSPLEENGFELMIPTSVLARATLTLFAISRFEWDLCATYRSKPILPPIPSECAWSVVVVTVLRGPRRGFAGYAITGFFGAGRGGVGRMRSDVVPGVEGRPTFGAPHRRAAPDPFETIA